ncbi:MAG: hypothetical protein HYV46_22595 [candidate division NC10 bacterium]|nr:hypothetical protein [candidate division NC10 bacterium]
MPRQFTASAWSQFLATACLVTLFAHAAEAGTPADKRLFVLQKASGAVIEYDLKTGTPVNSVPVPPETFKQDHPIVVSHRGEVLISFYRPDGDAVLMRHWLWDGAKAQILTPKVSPADDSDGWAYPRALLSADGGNPFWYKTDMKVSGKADAEGSEQAVTPTFQMFRGTLSGPGAEKILQRAFAECKCSTGACSETCSVGWAWAPHGVIQDFFFVTYFVPGQLQPSYESTYLFTKRGDKWTGQKRAEASEEILDAKRRGEIMVEAVPDAGCCGWANDSSDMTIVRRSGSRITIFDEWSRYNNQRYDVSFFSSNAEISPDGSRVAHTITSSMDAGGPSREIRLGSDVPLSEKLTPEEIAKLREVIARHPLVEVVALDSPSRLSLSIQQATLIGWLSDKELLILKDKKLHIVNAQDGKTIRTLPLSVDRAEYVFLR